MKSLFFSLTLALVAPFAAYTSNATVAESTIQSPTSQISPALRSISVAITQDWYNYTAKDGSYSAKFPRQPEEENRSINSKVGELKFVQAIYEDKEKQRVFLTQSTKFPVTSDQVDVEKVLDGARDGQSEDGKELISERKISLKGFSGRELIIQSKNKFVMKSRIFINPAEPTMHIVMVGSRDGNVNFPEAQAFLDSFMPK